MRIIDLLNKIANGEEVPKKIIGKNSAGKKEEYIYNDFWYIHIFENPDGEEDYYYMNRDIKDLNNEIEILEEENKIENIITFYDNDIEEYVAETKINNIKVKEHYGSPFEQMIIEKIKELIDEINKIKEQ